jgi:starvation-inducible outer membrane lipoprotein
VQPPAGSSKISFTTHGPLKNGTHPRHSLPSMAFMMTTFLKRSPIFFVILFMILDLAGCASNPLFPPKVTDGIDEHFDFEVWRKTPNTGIGHKIELAGRVVRSDMRNGETFAIVEQLPIVDGLVYETLALKKRIGEYGVFYRATIDPKWLGAGNLLMVIGTVTQPKAVAVNGVQHTFPFLIAECLRLWRTEGKELPQSQQNAVDRLASFDHTTYCASSY